MSKKYKVAKTPYWFWIFAIVLVLWHVMGIVNFIQHITITNEALDKMSESTRNLYGNYPIWANISFAIAVFFGTAGTAALMLKKQIALWLYIISAVGVLGQVLHSFSLISKLDDYAGYWLITVMLLVLFMSGFSIWLSRLSQLKNWIK